MQRIKSLIVRHPLISFVVIAFAWTCLLASLIDVSLLLPLLGLFGPSVAAVAVMLASRGRPGFVSLIGKFRMSLSLTPWLAVTILLPLVLLVPMWLVYWWLLGYTKFEIASLEVISLVLALLIVGEEIGWRGFLLPSLLERHSALVSAVLVGLIWAFWHLPNFLLPGYPHYRLPFLAFLILAISYSVLFTWFYLRTGGSLLVATVFHAALNLFSLSGVDASKVYWLKAAIYSFAAFLFIAIFKELTAKYEVN